MSTIADVFNPEDRVSVKYSDFYRIIESSCSQAAALMYIKNALMAGVPNEYIQSMLDGQKHWQQLDVLKSGVCYCPNIMGSDDESVLVKYENLKVTEDENGKS